MTVSARFDAPLPGSALERRTNPLTGALEVRYPLTWTGVRTYRRPDGRVTRELRRPEQVFAASHLRTLRRLAATIGHPQLEDGTPVFLDARGGPGVSDGGTALRPAEDFQVGHTGDEIVREEVDGYPVPVAWCSVTAARAQRLIAGGALQSSLGYLAYLDEHAEPQVWDGPHGPEEYDVEHVLDHEDPRVRAAVERGELPTVRLVVDGEEQDVPVLGGNHLAIAIRAGRGAKLSEVRLDADAAAFGSGTGGEAAGEVCCGACHDGHAESCDGAGCVLPGAWSSPAGRRADAALDCLGAWTIAGPAGGGGWSGVLLGLAPGLPADLAQRPLSETYAAGPEGTGGWLGYLQDEELGDASPWVAFARADGLLLAWPLRGPGGEVLGPPCVVARDAAGSAGVAAPAARADGAAYAAPATAPVGEPAAPPAPPRRTLTVKKLTLPAKLDKAAQAVAQALGAGAPARKADALEIELPESMDPAMLAAALHAMASAMEKMQGDKAALEGQMAALEGAKAEADKMCGSAMAEAEKYKADADALRADAEEGRAIRLERVKAAAKARVAGLTDADLQGDADQVRKAAIARWIPKAAPRLDSAPGMVDSLWEALLALPEISAPVKPASKPSPRTDEDDGEPVKLTPPVVGSRRLTAHDVD